MDPQTLARILQFRPDLGGAYQRPDLPEGMPLNLPQFNVQTDPSGHNISGSYSTPIPGGGDLFAQGSVTPNTYAPNPLTARPIDFSTMLGLRRQF